MKQFMEVGVGVGSRASSSSRVGPWPLEVLGIGIIVVFLCARLGNVEKRELNHKAEQNDGYHEKRGRSKMAWCTMIRRGDDGISPLRPGRIRGSNVARIPLRRR
jgi:hypothetical protein